MELNIATEPRQIAPTSTGEVIECSAFIDASAVDADDIARGMDDRGRPIALRTGLTARVALAVDKLKAVGLIKGDLVSVADGRATVIDDVTPVSFDVAALLRLALSTR